MMAVYIRSVASYLPQKRVSNDDLAKIVDTNDEWIRSHTGIGFRHIADDSEAVSDLVATAAKRALQKAGIAAQDISLIILATSTQDYLAFPSTACIVQNKIGATKAAAFDLSAACSGFVYSVSLAEAMIKANGGNVLVLAGDVLSRILDWSDRNTCVLFGDGAGAALLSADPGADCRPGLSGILATTLRAYGSDWDAIKIENAGFRMKQDRLDRSKPAYIAMDGRRTYTFAVNENVELVKALAEKAGVKLEDIKWFVPHQANARIIQAAAKRLGIDESRFFLDIEEHSNTSAATIPIALSEMDDRGLLRRGDLVASVGFGAGLASGGILYRW
jgi:3-oxoacyl-[acyl-carrier-protein] synthase III